MLATVGTFTVDSRTQGHAKKLPRDQLKIRAREAVPYTRDNRRSEACDWANPANNYYLMKSHRKVSNERYCYPEKGIACYLLKNDRFNESWIKKALSSVLQKAAGDLWVDCSQRYSFQTKIMPCFLVKLIIAPRVLHR